MLFPLGPGPGGHLGDFLGDGRLPHPVEFQRQLPQQLLRVLVGAVHGGHAGLLLTAEAVDEGAVDKAGHIAGHHAVQHRLHAGQKLNGGGHRRLNAGGVGKMGPVEGQNPGAPGLEVHAVPHVGVHHVDFVQPVVFKAVQQQRADLPGPCHGGVLGGVEEAVLNGDAVGGKKTPPILPHHIQLGVRVGVQQLQRLLDGVLVIGPRQPLVGGDDQTGVWLIQGCLPLQGVEVGAVHHLPAHGAEDALDLPAQGLKVGPGVVQLLPGPAQLGGGDEVHGAGDLLGLLDAVDVVLDLLGPGHINRPAFRRPGTGPDMPGPGPGSPPGRPRTACRSGRCGRTGRRPPPPRSPAARPGTGPSDPAARPASRGPWRR